MKTFNQFWQKVKGKYIDSIGKIGNKLSWVYAYMGQCASLARQFLVQCYGYPDRPYGNGGDFGSIPKGKRLKTPKDWCIVVYPVQPGLPYGHVAIFYKGKMISQNPNKVALIPLWKGKKFFVQPHQYKKQPSTSKPKPIAYPNGFKKFKKTRVYKAKYEVIKRLQAKKNGTRYGITKVGDVLKCIGYIDADGFRRLGYINKKGQLTFVAEAPLKFAKAGRKKYEKHFYFKDITK